MLNYLKVLQLNPNKLNGFVNVPPPTYLDSEGNGNTTFKKTFMNILKSS